ncbi:U3 small nucleolar ribonucleoprotein protein MPP10 [Pristis pectinata]|uniref:U3 small nucleolar ribonucleoprotein protein MPP10 n=1 Tax=Pristis pectinata TaxID=685728 RepID=UPI00223D6E42|nr:U3 small nucleolar ribonucleoprotein protein MPP10 [Pristis pectinata]
MAALGGCVQRLVSAVERPELLLSVQDRLASEFTALTKELYDFQKTQEADGAAGSPLKELVVEHFDEEQIWQEIELQNRSVLNYFKGAVAFLRHDSLSRLNSTEEAEIDSPAEEFEMEDDYEPEESSDEEKELKKQKVSGKKDHSEKLSDEDSDINFNIDELVKRTKLQKKSPKLPSSELDDKFFKLSEMEAFLEKAEKEEANLENYDDEINYFEDIPSEDEEIMKTKIKKKTKSSRNLQYKDYFDPIESSEEPAIEDGKAAKWKLKLKEFGDDQNLDEDRKEMRSGRVAKGAYKKVSFDLSDDNEEADLASVIEEKNLEEEKSNFEKRQEKLRAQIQQLEKSALEQKPWQLLGEVTAQKRPENSLLEEDLLFDHTVRKAPVITEETTLQLEDVIIQRIKDQAWDDVLRKEKPKEETFEYKKRLTLDHEKSKLSLAEVYEQEYQKQTEQKSEVEENQQYTEIQKMMDSLFLKLDALSNFHFTPKPPVPELKVVSNLPSINMEEVAPVNVSDATLLAPEEIKEKGRAGVLQGENEKTPTDKKRERRRKKKLKRLRIRAKEVRQKGLEKQNVKLSNKQEKEMNSQKAKKLAQQGKVMLLKDEGKDKNLHSSKAFFSHLQDQVKVELSGVKIGAKKKKEKHGKLSANKLKL